MEAVMGLMTGRDEMAGEEWNARNVEKLWKQRENMRCAGAFTGLGSCAASRGGAFRLKFL